MCVNESMLTTMVGKRASTYSGRDNIDTQVRKWLINRIILNYFY